jgi:hypothetical protein
MKDIAIKIFVGKQQFQKGTFVYFIFLNANKFESLRPAMPKTIVASLHSFEFRCLTEPKYREPKSMNWKHNFKILMNSVEDYARQWAKREEDLYTLSEWVKNVRSGSLANTSLRDYI